MTNIWEAESGDQETLVEAQRDFLSTILEHLEDKETRAIARRSQYMRLIEDVATAARLYAEEHEISPDSFRWTVLPDAISPVHTLQVALAGNVWQNDEQKAEGARKYYNFWRHEADPLRLVHANKTPEIDRQEVESAVGEYLAGEIRTKRLDTLFVDVLMGMEVYAYADEMTNTGGVHGQTPLKSSPIFWPWLGGALLELLVFIGLVSGVIYARSVEWISENWSFGIAIALIAFYLLSLARSLVALPIIYRRRSKLFERCSSSLASMVQAYCVLRTSGPISITYLRSRLSAASDNDVVWPTPLYALLDDIETRSTRLEMA